MKPSVLILIERLGIGGLETHVASIASSMNNSFDFYLAGYKGDNVAYFKKYFKEVIELDDNVDLTSTIEILVQAVINKNISKIHVHQVGVYGEAYLLSKETKIPYYVTSHGLVHPVDHWKKMIPFRAKYWTEIIFKKASGFSTISSIHLDFWRKASPNLLNKSVITRNCINEEQFSFAPTVGFKHVLATRFEEEKRRAIDESISYVENFRKITNKNEISLTIFGAGNLFQEYLHKYKNSKYISIKKPVAEISKVIGSYDIVLGAGRSALEGIASGKLTMIVGPWGSHGIIEPQNFGDFSESNFNGKNMKVIATKDIIDTINFLETEARMRIVTDNYEILKESFGKNVIIKDVESLYELNSSEPSPEGVTETMLVEADKYIMAEKRYLMELEGLRFQYNILEKDTNDVYKKLNETLSSKSWRITRPLRYFSKLVRDWREIE